MPMRHLPAGPFCEVSRQDYVSSRYGYDLARSLAEIRPAYRHKESCQESVPEAIIAFLESRSFEKAVRNAVWLGGDSDTQAAIAGSIAEAFYGGVPQELREAALARLDDRLRGDVAAWYHWLSEYRGIRLDRKADPVQEQKTAVSATGRDIMEIIVTRQIILCTASCSFGMRKWETLPAYRI